MPSRTWRTRGETVCSNSLKVSRKLVESVLLETIQKDLFTDDGLAVFTQEMTRLLAEQRRARRPDLATATTRLQAVEQEIANIMQAIKAGILTVSTKAELERAEAERATLTQTVQGRTKVLDKVGTFLPNMEKRFKGLIDDLIAVAQPEVDKARGMVRQLVGGQIPLHAASDGTERFLTAELSGDYSGLMALAVGSKINMVAVSRIERETRGL